MRKLILVLLLFAYGESCAVVGQTKRQNQQRQTDQQVAVSPTPTPSVQPTVEIREPQITGNEADRARSITIVDERSPWPSRVANIISALLLLFVAYQAYTNNGILKSMKANEGFLESQCKALTDQAKAMEGQAKSLSETLLQTTTQLEIEIAKVNPRLRVSKVRMENFEEGQSPIFIVTIANDGLIPAANVELHIGINLGDGREFNWIEPQTVMIPARGEESYPIITGASLSQPDMRGFRTVVPIEVKVRVKYWPGSPDEPQEFCYRYFPWPGKRPDDVRQFFPCDFKHNLNISLRISGMQANTAMGTAGVVIKKTPEEGKEKSEDEAK